MQLNNQGSTLDALSTNLQLLQIILDLNSSIKTTLIGANVLDLQYLTIKSNALCNPLILFFLLLAIGNNYNAIVVVPYCTICLKRL